MERAVIVAAKRTAIGSFGGVFTGVSTVQLGVTAAKAVIGETSISPDQFDDVIVGCVLSAGLGQNVARQISIQSDIPREVPAYSINRVCGSGLQAVANAAMMIQSGDAQIVLAGGAENMTQAPYVLPQGRYGGRMGHVQFIDSMIHDGLFDIFNKYHMGITAENLAEQWKITRQEMDVFSAGSQAKAVAAIESGRFVDEIVPVEIPGKKGDVVKVATDEFPRKGVTAESLGNLKPAFKKDGAVTAGNASGINDGAAMMIVTSESKARELNLKPIAAVTASAVAGVDPSIMGYGPVPAITKALKKAGWKLSDIELAELNEAFAAQSLAVMKGLERDLGGIDPSIVNVNGGAIALGHPIGASGARVLVTLLYELMKRNKKKGVASLCIGGGMGIAMLVENLR